MEWWHIVFIINISVLLIFAYPIYKVGEFISEYMYLKDMNEYNKWKRRNGL